MMGVRRSRTVRVRGFVLASALTVLAVAVAPATAGNSKWTEQDFRLRDAAASLGPLGNSQIAFSGTMSQQAFSAGLSPQIDIAVGLAITCHPDGDPGDTQTYTGQYYPRIAGGQPIVTWTTQYQHPDAGTVKWTETFVFQSPPITGQADFYGYAWCGVRASGAQVLDAISITGVTGAAWLSSFWASPQPGTSLYSVTIGAGNTAQRFQPKDGTPY